MLYVDVGGTNMSESTKNATEFLFEWAREQGDWALLLTNKVLRNSPLTDDDREEIIESLIFSQNSPVIDNIIDNSCVNNNVYQKIRLKKLSDVIGVNKLAHEQELTFHDKLTIVYGDNGTGKTGYYRILKSIGSSVEKDRSLKILSNVFVEPEQASATIDYIVDGKNESLSWINNNETIPGVVVFDSRCAKISLDSKRKTNIKPVGFEYFNIISQELTIISNQVDKKISEFTTQLLLKEFSNDTEVKIFFNSLSCSDPNEKIDNFIFERKIILEEISSKIDQLSKTEKHLNPEIISQLLQSLSIVKSECKNYQELVEKLKINFAKEKILEYLTAVEENNNTLKIIPEFNDFLAAAQKYVEKHLHPNYPNEGDHCIYCGQKLSPCAIENINDLQALLKSDSAQKYEHNKSKIAAFEKEVLLLLPLPYKQDIFNLSTKSCGNFFGLNGILNEHINRLKAVVADGVFQKEDCDSILNFNYDKQLDLCKEFDENIDKENDCQKERLTKLEELLVQNHNSMAELLDYKWFLDNIEKIKKHLSLLKLIETYKNNKSKLNNYKLSAKMKLAEKKIITEIFNDTLLKEFSRLGCPDGIKVDVSIDKTETSIKQNIEKNPLDIVLSEGEQKIVSLAEFIAEALIDDQIQILIFDDPVNSLDVARSQQIATRLVELSNYKQIVIFTHNIILFNDLQVAINRNEQTCYRIEADLNYSGIICSTFAPKDENINKYLSKISEVLKREGKRTKPIEDELREGYASLRSALECLYEKDFLQESILRFRRNIMFGKLDKIKWIEFESNKQIFIEIYDRACSAISGHTSPEGTQMPTMRDLNNDYNKILEIKKIIS